MSKKSFILFCVLIGGVIGGYYGWALTEVNDEMSPEAEASLHEIMNLPENRDAFVGLIEPEYYAAMKASSEGDVENVIATNDTRSYAEYADYLELCSEHYGAVTLLVSKDGQGNEILRLIGPQEEVDYIRTKTTASTSTDVHYCQPLEY